ncbi:MAG: 6-bladed beta-propeller [Niabella sp.]
MRKLPAIFCLLVYLSAYSQNGKDLYFQPNFAIGVTASKIFDEVTYIPLQTNKKSLFGRIKQLLVSDNYFIIWDADTNSIYFFDKTGKFIKKYRPPKCTIKNIQLDKSRNALFITGSNKNFKFSQAEIEKMMEDPTNPEFARFSWSGYYDLKDIHKEKVQEIKHFSLSLVTPTIFGASHWVYSYAYANRKWEDNTDYELKVYSAGKTVSAYFPYNKKNSALFCKPAQISFFPGQDSSKLLFTRPYNYSIYELNSDSISLLYTLILPMENSLPGSFLSYPFRSKNDFDNFRMKNGSWVWSIDHLFRYNNYLFFSLDYNKSFREKSFMLDEASGRFYNISKISPDSTNAYLPLLTTGIQFCDGNYLYGSTSSNYMFQTKDNTQSRSPQYMPAIKAYFDKSSRTANPVIIQVKLKNKIG